uniref:DUF4168 domain-containing protein n=1 Tax=Cyanothece sp. (strain PCC 7425 / ATCC 29141) TaxID=395961 RepID=B8HU30_CYAP4
MPYLPYRLATIRPPQLCTALLLSVLSLGSVLENGSFGSLFSASFPPALGQTTISTDQVSSYARAVLSIEPIRRRYYQQAQQVMKGAVPKNSCLGNNRANVPQELEDICSSYLSESKTVIEKNKLTLEQFNEITMRARSDTALNSRIQQELVRQQQLATPPK